MPNFYNILVLGISSCVNVGSHEEENGDMGFLCGRVTAARTAYERWWNDEQFYTQGRERQGHAAGQRCVSRAQGIQCSPAGNFLS